MKRPLAWASRAMHASAGVLRFPPDHENQQLRVDPRFNDLTHEMTKFDQGFSVHRLGQFAIVGVIVFVLVCGAAQFLRTDLDWIHAPLSFYLIGPGGWLVKGAYFALSLSLVAVGLGFSRSLAPPARSVLPGALFCISALSLVITAFSDTATHRGEVSLHSKVHAFAAGVTFICVTTAMLLQSLRLRIDAAWRRSFRPMSALAVTTFLALWLYALTHVLPKGLMQKIVICLIITWLVQAALALRGK